jgi:hypothetical protein
MLATPLFCSILAHMFNPAFSAAFLLAALLSVQVCAEEKSVDRHDLKDTARVFPCVKTTETIVIDGKLDEELWKKAAKQKFIMNWAAEKSAPTLATVQMAWDDDFIYFAGDLEDADIFADVKERDGSTWTNDVFELFIKPAVDKPVYFEFHITAANVITDIRMPRPGAKQSRRNAEWDSKVTSAVHLNGTLNQRGDKDTGWTVEVRIPWTDFAEVVQRPVAGTRWTFATGRYDITQGKKDVNSSTALLTECKFHNIQEYDWIEFKE